MSEEKNIKQEERFDDLYRQSLEPIRVEPSARVWNRMSRQLLWRELLRLNFSNLPGYTWVIVSAVAVVVGFGIYWLASGDPVVIPPSSPVSTLPQTQAPTQPAAPEIRNEPSPSSSVTPAPTAQATPAVAPGKEVSHPASTAQPSPPPSALPLPERVTTSAVAEQSKRITVENEWIMTMDGLLTGVYTLPGPTLAAAPARMVNPEPNPNPPVPAKTSSPISIPQSLNMGVNITPDMVFYKNTSSYFKYDYTFDAGVQYSIGRFYLQSGAGIVWSTDIGTYAISANKNDSVGYYFSVVSFSESPTNPGEMDYTTTMNTVYDTNQYLYDYSARNTYTYLEIPLTVGFKAVNKPMWSLGVEAGGFWSCMLQSNEPPPVFYLPEGRVTDIENMTPVRRKNSFGLTGSIRFEYRFAKQFSLLIAPAFKYHLNAIEENDIPGATQPWSVGLRAGIWYRIDIKK